MITGIICLLLQVFGGSEVQHWFLNAVVVQVPIGTGQRLVGNVEAGSGDEPLCHRRPFRGAKLLLSLAAAWRIGRPKLQKLELVDRWAESLAFGCVSRRIVQADDRCRLLATDTQKFSWNFVKRVRPV